MPLWGPLNTSFGYRKGEVIGLPFIVLGVCRFSAPPPLGALFLLGRFQLELVTAPAGGSILIPSFLPFLSLGLPSLFPVLLPLFLGFQLLFPSLPNSLLLLLSSLPPFHPSFQPSGIPIDRAFQGIKEFIMALLHDPDDLSSGLLIKFHAGAFHRNLLEIDLRDSISKGIERNDLYLSCVLHCPYPSYAGNLP